MILDAPRVDSALPVAAASCGSFSTQSEDAALAGRRLGKKDFQISGEQALKIQGQLPVEKFLVHHAEEQRPYQEFGKAGQGVAHAWRLRCWQKLLLQAGPVGREKGPGKILPSVRDHAGPR